MDTDTPVTFIPLREEKITRKELLQNISDNEGKAFFMIKHNWYNIHVTDLHDKLEALIEDGYLLMAVDFKPMTIDDNDIIFLVCVNDTSEYLINDLPYADDHDL